ncbi:MAG: hypothetical protein JWM57_4174 [Phycisphaerales bacterium]|nr:hypothetical protein [Phycisphaerales bacterium]
MPEKAFQSEHMAVISVVTSPAGGTALIRNMCTSIELTSNLSTYLARIVFLPCNLFRFGEAFHPV